jgi:uncharacterized RDD family membrane protein YckC
MLDTVREAHTPEGVALRLPAAGPLPRALAWGIDAAIRGAVLMVASMLLGLLGKSGLGLFLLVVFALLWGYPVLFEVLRDGQTPGKRSMHLRVIRDDGAPVGWQASIVRNLMRTVDMLPLFYAVGLVAGLFDPAGRRLGDIVAGTLVIHVPPRERRKALHAPPPPAAAVAGSPLRGVALLAHEQAAVVAFSERAAGLTPERQEELAGLAFDLTGERGRGGVVRLHAIAAHLLGR